VPVNAERRGRHPAVLALVAILALEAAALAAAAAFLLVDSTSHASGAGTADIALVATTALLALGVVMLAVGVARRWPRVRGGIVVWQVLQIAAAIAAFQGLLGPAWIGWIVLAPALAGLWLALSRPVTRDVVGA